MTRPGAEVHPYVPANVLDKLDRAAKAAVKLTGNKTSRTDIATAVLKAWAARLDA